MGFFRKMFGQNDTVESSAVSEQSAPKADSARGIAYDPKLVDSLLGAHARLGGIFDRIGQAGKAGSHDEVRALLGQFKSGLQSHILTENVRFYAYVEELTRDDPDNARVMHEFRRDMNTIARKVVEFVKKYQTCTFATEAERDAFASEYALVGELLEQRLNSEESDLYPLYIPR